MRNLRKWTITCLMLSIFLNGYCQYSNLDKVADKVKSINIGSCDAEIIFKPLMGADTIRTTAYIEYNKSSFKKDSVGKILIKQNDSSIFYYDLNACYFINSNTHTYEQKNIVDLPLYKLLQGVSINSLIHRPLFSAKHDISSMYKFGAEKLDVYIENSYTIEYTVIDTTGPTTTVKIKYDKDYLMTYYEERVYYMNNIQFKSFTFKNHQTNNTPFLKMYVISMLEHYTVFESPKLNETELNPKYKVGDVIDSTLLLSLVTPKIQSKLLLVDFFYKSCFPCWKSFPAIDSLLAGYPTEKLGALGINAIDKPGVEFNKFMMKHDIKYPVHFDSTKSIVNSFNIKSYPTIYIVDVETQKVVFLSTGYSISMYIDMKKSIDEYLLKN